MTRTISGTYASTVTLTSVSDNPVSVTGNITAVANNGLYGIGGESNAWTITNYGVIVGGSNDGTGIALGGGYGPSGPPSYLRVNSSIVTNATGGTISGPVGIHIVGYANQPETVINQVGGTITGYYAGVILETQTSANEATVVNSGVISASSTFSGDGGVFYQKAAWLPIIAAPLFMDTMMLYDR
ncbi:hypothetical protein [Acidisphaera sp. S103]|uniref:hypothetical protein n=1 Tax=Acidisphaera sp. S103 TaxID=1747223 RepID=UPI00131CA348|nr:hypothetical protein [Acidisphaera sp. S103]